MVGNNIFRLGVFRVWVGRLMAWLGMSKFLSEGSRSGLNQKGDRVALECSMECSGFGSEG